MSFQVKTSTHAKFLAEAARKRAAKAIELAETAQRQANEYEELALTLPESAAPAGVPSEFLSLTAGASVNYRFGRGEKSVVFSGTIVAVKVGENGKASQYRVQSGDGFETEIRSIFPGQITEVN